MNRTRLTALIAFAATALPQLAGAGSFIAVEEDEPGRVAHQNYQGAGGELAQIRVCIDNSVNPALAAAAEPAVRNVVATYNRIRSLADNTYAEGAATSAPPDQVDFETVLLHEFMHANGLDHPNQANNPAGAGGYNYGDSRSADGANNVLDHLGDADGIPGSADDQRGDDVNLLWYPRGTNDPAVLPAVVDTTTMARTLDHLPPGQHFAANANSAVMAALGHPNSEAVAVQGYVQGQVGRHLHHDDLAMLQLARAGIDGLAGTADDYRTSAVFAGFFNNPQGGECSMVVRFIDEVGFAGTLVGLTPLAPNHWRLIYPTRMRFNPAVNWYFTPGANTAMQIDPATPGTSSGVTPYTVQVTVAKAGYNLMSGTPRGSVIVRDGARGDPLTAACSIDLTPASGGSGSCLLTPVTAGRKILTADYVGWGGWDGNTASVAHDATGVVTFANITQAPSPSAIGVDVNFDWALVPPGGGAPVQASGSVVVKEAADCASAPADPALQCSATLPAHGCSIRFSSPGTHTLRLCYSGDSAVAPAQASVVHTVLAGRATATSILAQSSSLTKPYEPYTVQVQVREVPDQGGHPQGTVIVRDGDDSDPLTARCTATLAGTPDETASCQLASNRAGVHPLTASFADQGLWMGSSSASLAHSVRSFAIVSNNPSSVPLGQAASVVVALEVAPFGATPAPSGTIVVSNGSDSCEIVLPASHCAWRGSSTGTHQLVASWSGDANYPAMTTAAVMQTVTPAAPYPRWVSQARSGYPESNAASTGSNRGLSADGRFVVFSSSATDLVGDDTNGVEDVFVRDQLNGGLRRVSVTAAGAQGNGASRLPAISADGRFVSFESQASNFFPGDSNDKDVFVKDLYSGALVRATTRADGSAPTTPELAFATTALRSSLSADGRFVAFATYRLLAPGDTNGRVDTYVKDLATGALDLVSSNSADQPGDNHSQFPAISADGRYVAYNSTAGNLVPNFPANGLLNRVFVKDRQTRVSSLASALADGTVADGACGDYPAISADGRYVAFQCSATNLPALIWNGERVFVKDMSSGAIELAASSITYSNSRTPSLSADGRYVVFQTGINASPGYVAVVVKDRQSGQLVNQHVLPGSTPAQEDQVPWETRMWPSISADGRYVAYQSVSAAIAPPDNNAAADVFVRDRVAGLTQRASGAYFGLRNDGDSDNAAISRDGSIAVYDSFSSRLIDGDANGQRDVFVYRSGSGTATRLSTAADGTPANGASYAPALAEHTGDVFFLSAAGNLVAGDTNGKVDVFRRHSSGGSIQRMNLFYGSQASADAQAPLAVSGDGRIIAFASADGGIAGDSNGFTDIVVYRPYNNGSANPLTVAANGNSLQPAISDDGRILAFASEATNLGVSGAAGVRSVYARNMREYYNVPQPMQLVSADAAGVPANGRSEQPAVSADGRYVAFVSWATNLVPGDDNGVADIFVKDIQTGAIERVNTTAAGAQGAGGDCASPAFSSGARFVGFVCAQGNLVAGGGGTPAYYVKDRSNAAIVRLSQTAGGSAADAASSAGAHALADNGMGVFVSDAGNLAALDSPLVSNVFLNLYPAAFSASAVSIVSTSPAQPEVGRGYTVAVSVTGSGANPPTGRVRVFDGTDAYPTCVATLTPGTPSTGSCELGTGVSGTATLTAYYGGDDSNGAAVSPAFSVPVQDLVLPAKPIISTVTPGNGRATVQIGMSNVGSPFSGYTTTCGAQTQNSTGMPVVVTGLQNGVTVDCRVVVHNVVGSSPPSDPVSVTPRAGTSAAITAHTPNPSRVNLAYSVSVAVQGEGTPAPGGQVTVSDGAASCVAALTPGSPSVGNCTLVSTLRGSRTLTASYAGDSANTGSSGTAAHSVADVPAAPVLTQAAPGNGRATLTFGAPADNGGSAVLDYTASCGAQSAVDTQSPLAVTGLTNGTPVSCSVTARNALGHSLASNAIEVTPATVPGKPNLIGVQPGDGSATFTFSAPENDGGSLVDSYRAVCAGKFAAGPASPLVVTGLTNGTAVQCFLTAHNAMGFSAPAGPASVTPAAAPGAPLLTAAQPGDGRVTLVFDAPASNGGSAVLDYTATCGAQSATGPASPVSVSGLANDVEVSCSVRARNAATTGQPSNVLAATPAPARASTALALSSGTDPSQWGQPLSFTATLQPVAPYSATPGGSVTFKDDGTPVSGCTDLALTTTAPVTATCTTAALGVGPHSLTAQYSGDAVYAAAQQPVSNTLSHTVGRAVSTVDFDVLNFVYTGSTRTVTAHIHDEPATSCTVTPSSIGPDIGSTPVTASCEGIHYTASGSATAVIARAPSTVDFGTLNFTYDGSAKTVTARIHDEPATSCTVTPSSVGPNAGSTPVTASCEGTHYTASGGATAVIARAASTVDFGTLNFTYDGSAKAITARIHDEPATSCTVTPSSAGPGAGSTPVTASCAGTNYTATGNAAAVIAKAATTLTLTSDCQRTFVENQPYTLVARLNGGINATGSVSFDDGPASLCVNLPLLSGAATCVATLSAHQQAVATLALGARYGGDANHDASQATAINVTVLGLLNAIFRNGLQLPGDPDACPVE
ncbi:Ig-like domain repeat protein [Tahibacter harae]|uniref:Ig-like domain repeat protein n=1 Tax=Tahibacter harae TaxID=2963937 RepID=A0ABT1QLW8_9GAMM|nr:Ig-like domain repeat protein [Tahibacter harae]MCQ4163523.1 Ig-like domain repeat protein [Tahibacter harae]